MFDAVKKIEVHQESGDFNFDLLIKIHRDFVKELEELHKIKDFFPLIIPYLQDIIPFNAISFYALNEGDLSFTLQYCEPASIQKELGEEVERQIDEGNFAFALYQTRPILVESHLFPQPLLLMSLATQKKTWGMIVGVLGGEGRILNTLQEKLFTYLCANLAQILDNQELSRELKKQSLNLEAMVDERTVELAQNQTELMEANHRISSHLAALDVSRDGMAVLNSEFRINFANSTMRKMFLEYQSSDFLDGDLKNIIYLEDFKILEREVLPALKNEGHWLGEIRCINEKKEIIETEISLTQSGSYTAMTVRDIANKKALQKERDEIQKQLQHDRKLRMIGQLSGGMAHDFNNLLSSIVAYSSMLERKLTDEKQLRWVKNISKAGEQGSKLITKLQSFAKQSQYELLEENVNVFLEGYLKRNRHIQESKEVALEFIRAADLHACRIDIVKIEDALNSIIENALEAMEFAGTLSLKTDNYTINFLNKRFHPHLKEGEYIRISISDTGYGMGPEEMERAFEPFFTTKEIGQGSGLGLPMALGILESHQGDLTLHSRKGEGSNVNFYLPVSAQRATLTHFDFQFSKKVSILVVDNDLFIQDFVREVFLNNDVELLFASDAEQALNMIGRLDELDLIVLDRNFPGMSEKSLYQELSVRKLQSQLIIVSHFVEDLYWREQIQKNLITYMQKPFNPEKFIDALKNVIL